MYACMYVCIMYVCMYVCTPLVHYSENHPPSCLFKILHNAQLTIIYCPLYAYYNTKGIVLMFGDFNTNITLGKRSYPRPQFVSRRSYTLEQFMLSTDQTSLVSYAMCNGPIYTYIPYSGAPGTQIDHCLIQNCDICIVDSVYVHDECIDNTSDHNPVSVTLNCMLCKYDIKSRCRPTYRWDKADPSMYRDTLDGCVIQRNLINKVAESPHDIYTLYDELLRAIIDASDIVSMCAYGSNEVKT